MELKANSRTELGKKVRALRRAGFLPAVLYGEGATSQPIVVASGDFEKAYRGAGESTLVDLVVEGKIYPVLIHDLARDPLKGTPIHADFYAVRMDRQIRTKVPIEFFGESPAVKNEGAVLVKMLQEIEVEALPKDLHHELRIDLSSLVSLESKLLVCDILLPQGVKMLAEPHGIVALLEAPRSEEELAALKEAPAVVTAEVKTEREIKAEAKKEEKEPEGAASEKS